MHRNTLKLTLVSFSALASVSCSTVFNGPEDSLTVAETHPIAVDSQIVTITVELDPSTNEISSLDQARLRAFANAYLTNGHGPLTLTAPSGTGADLDGHETVADIRKTLFDAGVAWSSMGGATYRTGPEGSANQVIVSYTHYVATASKCGIWSGVTKRNYKNLRAPNFGCATQNNLAALVADPHDLISPADSSFRDANSTTRAIDLYRSGEATSSAVGDIEVDTAQ